MSGARPLWSSTDPIAGPLSIVSGASRGAAAVGLVMAWQNVRDGDPFDIGRSWGISQGDLVFSPTPPEQLAIDDLATLHLDYVAQEKGYSHKEALQ